MVEGGGGLLGQFLDQDLADEVAVFIAPMLIGGDRVPGELAAVTPWPGGGADLARCPRLAEVRVRRLGADMYVRGAWRPATDGWATPRAFQK